MECIWRHPSLRDFSITSNTSSAGSNTIFQDIINPGLANVVWVAGSFDEHPPENVTLGEHWVVSLVNTIMMSGYWDSTAIFITWDDYGGWYDHVPPPQVDKFGYGFRAPLLVISPYAKKGFIDDTLADHTSILKFIETVFSLPPLAERDRLANNLMEAFDFSQDSRPPMMLPGQFIPDHYPLVPRANARNMPTYSVTSEPLPRANARNMSTYSVTSEPLLIGFALGLGTAILAVVILPQIAANLRSRQRSPTRPLEEQ